MPRPTTITTTLVKQIRELHALGVPHARIARDLGLNQQTVRRYATPEGEAAVKAEQRRRYEKDRSNPERTEKLRASSREYARRKRAEEKAAGVKTKRELAAEQRERYNAQKREARATQVKEPGTERQCVVCKVTFRSIYRNNTCSREHALEHKQRYLKRWKAERAGGMDDGGLLSLGAAGGGHRVGEAHGS
ncbi:hypothetical protein [Rhizobium phage RHph_X3_2]|nr:hypothetical protein [Rhizobium phage RHph_X3_2]